MFGSIIKQCIKVKLSLWLSRRPHFRGF